VAQTRMPAANGGAQTMRLVEPEPMPAPFVPAPEPVADAPPVPVKSLADIVALADAQRDIAFKVLVKRCVRLVRIEPGRIDVSLTDDAPKMLLNDLTAKLRAWTGRSWLVSLSKEAGGQTLAEMESTKRENALLDAKSDPTVAAILARFPGAKIIDVRIPDAPETDAVEADLPIEPAADDDET
jgi:DNA polymerase III subunit gamma/tau